MVIDRDAVSNLIDSLLMDHSARGVVALNMQLETGAQPWELPAISATEKDILVPNASQKQLQSSLELSERTLVKINQHS